eukprot:CAMPEP_0115844434 /NCGR_PEP_ID=MMETSP0287-20121206/8826_1 /TAXON_ID=412157 /ORGANISM="Chrysochromulina rotalis, Strain UIO044" /LENGTH=261 /DNA_ID=CAMNT_0003298159 /DNA_START=35 /DNA_END=820 /DNA_ORIENTATION=-
MDPNADGLPSGAADATEDPESESGRGTAGPSMLLVPGCVAPGCGGGCAHVSDEANLLQCLRCGFQWQSFWWWDHLDARGSQPAPPRAGSLVGNSIKAQHRTQLEDSTASQSAASISTCWTGDRASMRASPTASPCSESSPASVIDGDSDREDGKPSMGCDSRERIRVAKRGCIDVEERAGNRRRSVFNSEQLGAAGCNVDGADADDEVLLCTSYEGPCGEPESGGESDLGQLANPNGQHGILIPVVQDRAVGCDPAVIAEG